MKKKVPAAIGFCLVACVMGVVSSIIVPSFFLLMAGALLIVAPINLLGLDSVITFDERSLLIVVSIVWVICWMVGGFLVGRREDRAIKFPKNNYYE